MAVRLFVQMTRLTLCLLALGVMLSASTASALRFDMQSGVVQVFLRESGSDLASIGPFDLNGPADFADFNAAPVAMTDFQFSALGIQDQAITQLLGGGSLPGLWGWFNIDVDVVATPGAGYTAGGVDLGGGNYFLSGTNVDLTGTVTVGHWLGHTKSVTLNFPSYTANANLSSTTLTLSQVELGGIVLDDELGFNHTFEIIADISFIGTLAIPEPGTGLLMGLGLCAFSARRRLGRAA